MSINIKKYTKDQMAKMVEDAVERCESLKSENADLIEKVKKEMAEKIALRNDLMAMTHSHENLKAKNVVLAEQISQMNGEAITRENVIANLKADADALRNKLTDTEAALGRANAEVAELKAGRAQQTKEIFEWQGSAQALHDDLLNVRDRANYAEAHPWRNLWAWVKRKLARKA